MDAEDREHSRFSASQADRNALCLGSTNLLQRVPALPTSSYAEEGNRAHHILEVALRNRCFDAKIAHNEYSDLFFEELNTSDNFFYSAVQTALDHVWTILSENPDAVMWIETRVIPPVEPPGDPEDAAGYCDILIYVPATRTLYVIDYKHGAGVVKDVRTARQIRQYAAGALFQDDPLVSPDQVDNVVLTIIQPRAPHAEGSVREHEITTFEAYEYLEEMNDIIRKALDPNAPLTPGEEQCRFCDAKALCPAREAFALKVASDHFAQIRDVKASLLPLPSNLDIHRLGLIRAHAPALRKWLDDCEDYAYGMAMRGHAIPGAKLVEANPKRSYFYDEKATIEKVMALSGATLDAVAPRKLVPLTQAEKLVVDAYKSRVAISKRKKAAEDARHAFAFVTTKQSSGNLQLVSEDDPRPAVNATVQHFGQVQGLLAAPTQNIGT